MSSSSVRVFSDAVTLHEGDRVELDALLQVLPMLGASYQSSQGGKYFWQGDHLLVSIDNEPAIFVRSSGGYVTAVTDVKFPPMMIGIEGVGERVNRAYVPFNKIPKVLIQQLVATEDHQFYHHHGISLRGVARAFLANAKAGKVVQGASTLTQQWVKNTFLTRERTYWRKINEVLMSLLVELRYSKDEILEAYMNDVYLGQQGNTEIRGFEAASEYYFGQTLAQIDPAQMAVLVGMVKGPTYYDPVRHPKRAQTRRNLVIDEWQQQYGAKPQAKQWQATTLTVYKRKASVASNRYPSVMKRISFEFAQLPKTVQQRATDVYTSINPFMQLRMQSHVRAPKSAEAAMIAVDHQGRVVALNGGRGTLNRVYESSRQVGSLAKPWVLSEAYSQGYLPTSKVLDAPLNDRRAPGWNPQNYDKKSHGEVLLIDALARSFNQTFARLTLDLNISKVSKRLSKITGTDVPKLPSVALGSFEMTPYQVANAYLAVANEGQYQKTYLVQRVTDGEGRLWQRKMHKETVLKPAIASMVGSSMEEVVRSGSGRSLAWRWSDHPVLAAKTGTSNNGKDAWFVTMSKQYVFVVWVGRDHPGKELGGASNALPIWVATMKGWPLQDFDPKVPKGYSKVWINSKGLTSGPNCGAKRAFIMPVDKLPQAGDVCGRGNRAGKKVSKWFSGLFG